MFSNFFASSEILRIERKRAAIRTKSQNSEKLNGTAKLIRFIGFGTKYLNHYIFNMWMLVL